MPYSGGPSTGHHPAVEQYLETILELEESGIPPLRARLVDRLGVTAPAVSETVNAMVDIEGPRTYGGDDGRPIPSGAVLPTPSQSPRFQFPQVTIPKPSLPITLPLPRGKSPSPSPGH